MNGAHTTADAVKSQIANKMNSLSDFKIKALHSKFAVVGIIQKHRRITVFGI